MTPSINYDYGSCPCSGFYDNRRVEVRLNVNGRVEILSQIQQGACPLCGSRVYKINVLDRIESLMRSTSLEVDVE